jgi:hypothetical protein
MFRLVFFIFLTFTNYRRRPAGGSNGELEWGAKGPATGRMPDQIKSAGCMWVYV